MLLAQSNVRHRVVITGIGVITPVGNDVELTWQGLIAGRSGIQKIPQTFGLEGYSVKAAGLVTGESEQLSAVIHPKSHNKMDRFIQLALIAGSQAMRDAQLSQELPPQRTRFGVYCGVGFGGLDSISQAVIDLHKQGPNRVSPFAIPRSICNLAPGWLSMQWNLQGPSLAIANACASSTDAVGLAFRAIRDGYADYMMAGGAECSVTPIGIAAFGNMRALATWDGDPTQASRPFDRQRSGFVMSEGAASLILEREDFARKRGAKIYAEVVGYGATSDAYHITAMHPEGRAAVWTMQRAMADAQIAPEAVGYINAHGTSTLLNDATETKAIKTVFGTHCLPQTPDHLMVSSTKSMTGHMLGATGAAEAVFTALALHHGQIPPTINLETPDPECDLDYVPLVARKKSIEYALSNSFGFGGAHATLALKKYC